MRRGWPRTVWWYVTLDMWKLVLLTTAVLAAVIAFAIAVKPLADGKLDPVNALKFMGLAMIPALQYVLPFAACFGATMAYHRLSVDNELTACHAGGISHKSLLMPALLSGIILAACVWGLSNYAIPKFFRQMARILSDDATSLFITRIERGEAIEMGRGGWISADKVVSQGADEASGAFERLWLSGVMMIRTDKAGKVVSHGSAKSAAVWLKRVSEDGNSADPARRGKSATLVIIKPQNVVGIGGGKSGGTTRGWGADAVTSFTVPNAFSDDPKFLTFGELSDLTTRPEGMDFVEKRRVNLALVLAQRDTLDQLRSALRTGGKAEFADPFGARIVLHAAELRPTRRDGKRVANIMNIVPPGSPGARKQIVVERTLPDGKPVRQTADSGYVRLPVSIDPQHPGVFITLHLENVAATLVDDDEAEAPPELTDTDSANDPDVAGKTAPESAEGEVKERLVEDLRFVGSGSGDTAAKSSLDRLMAEPTSALITSADERIGVRALDADVLRWPRDDLSQEVNKLLREVLSKQHERWAMSFACLVMVVLGAAMAMRLRDALPLTVYVWAFFPAVLAMVAISGGQQMTHKHGAAGLLILYAGVVGLGIFAAVEYVKASRH